MYMYDPWVERQDAAQGIPTSQAESTHEGGVFQQEVGVIALCVHSQDIAVTASKDDLLLYQREEEKYRCVAVFGGLHIWFESQCLKHQLST